MKKIFTLLFACFAFVAANAQTVVDFEVSWFWSDTSMSATKVTDDTIRLAPTADFIPSFRIKNNSAQTLNPTDTLYVNLFVNSIDFGYIWLPGSALTGFASGAAADLNWPYTILEADTMDMYNINMFDVTVAVGYSYGVSDNVIANNGKKVTVKRMLDMPSGVDFELVAFKSDTLGTSTITTLNLANDEDLFPVIEFRNNGAADLLPTDTLLIGIMLGEKVLGSYYWLGSWLAGFNSGMSTLDWLTQPLLTADDMNKYMMNDFQLTYVLVAPNDVNMTNNMKTLHVIRGGVGVDEVSADEVNVYPNPAVDVIYVAKAENAQISVYDANGRLMTNIENASANQKIDATGFAAGLYMVRVAENGNVMTKKVNIVK